MIENKKLPSLKKIRDESYIPAPAVPPKLTVKTAQLDSLTRKTARVTNFTNAGSKASSSLSYRLPPTACSLKSTAKITIPHQCQSYCL